MRKQPTLEAKVREIMRRYNLDDMNPEYEKNLGLAAKAIARAIAAYGQQR